MKINVPGQKFNVTKCYLYISDEICVINNCLRSSKVQTVMVTRDCDHGLKTRIICYSSKTYGLGLNTPVLIWHLVLSLTCLRPLSYVRCNKNII